MAVARHCVNRSQAQPGYKVVVFGAGPIGLGAVIWLKLRGVRHVAVADVLPGRLQTALAVGADAVIDSSREDVTARLAKLHGQSANALGAPRPDTDIYIDAAGAAIVVNTALRAAKWGARLVTVAVHKKLEPIDLGAMLRSEMTIIASQGYPTEIFEVTPDIAEYHGRFSRLISHRVPFTDAARAAPEEADACPERGDAHPGGGHDLLGAVEGLAVNVEVVPGRADSHGDGGVEQEQEPEHRAGCDQRLHECFLSGGEL